MPKELEEKLRREAAAKGYKGDRADAYVYGTLRKTGWKPSREENSKKRKKAVHEELKKHWKK